MKLQLAKGSTSNILTVFIQDSSSTTGAGLGSLDQTSSIVGGYVRMGGTGVALAVDQNVTTEGTYEAPSTAAQVRIGTPTNMTTGTYELHFHNDLFAAGADILTITLSGASNMAPLPIEVQLTDMDMNDSVRGGMTALPNAAADAAGGLPISDAGGLDLDALNTAAVRLTAARAQVLDDWINAGRLDAILDIIAADVVNLDGAAMRGTDSAALASVCTEARLAELDAENLPADVDTLLGRVTATLFSGITSLAEWLGLIAGSQAGDATALTEIKATGAGSGTYDPTTDATEALRDRGDSAWTTGAGGDATEAKQDTIIAYIDTEIADILTDTGTTIPALIAALNDLSAAQVNTEVDTALSDYDGPTKAEMDTAHALLATVAALVTVDGNVDAIKVVTDALTAAAATKLALSAGTMVTGTVSHDNTVATTTIFYASDITEATADHYNGRIVLFTSGALQGQVTDIMDYELSAGEGKFTVTALTELPADNVTFIIV